VQGRNLITDNALDVLGFLRTRMALYHLSNVFFRDLQYGIRAFLQGRGIRVGYTEGEVLAAEFVEVMERKKIFKRIDHQTWVVEHEEFRTPQRPQAAKPAPARPAPAPAPPAPAKA
jgi:hypothetical protein